MSLLFRYLVAASLVAGLFQISGCGCACDPGPTMNIRGLIASDAYRQSAGVPAEKALDTLVYYLERYPNLIERITGTTEYTLFAPSNAAFASLKATPGFSTAPDALKRINPQLLGGLLSFHFVKGRKLNADLFPGTAFNAIVLDFSHLALPAITVNPDRTLRAYPGVANTAVNIVSPDAIATNGVVHVVELILTPYHTLVPIHYGTVAAMVLLNEAFSNIDRVIRTADQDFMENAANEQFKVTTWLSMRIATSAAPTANLKGITFFVPPNAAGSTPIFTTAMADAIIAQGATAARNFLLNHLVVSTPGGVQAIGQYVVGNLPNNNPNTITKFATGQTISPVTGASKRIFVNIVSPAPSTPTGIVLSNNATTPPPASSFIPILQGDLAATNGYLHAIGGVLE